MDLGSVLAARNYAETRQATQAVEMPGGNPLAQTAGGFVNILQEGEATAMAAMQSEASPHALVQALTQTEFAVEAAVTIRDKVVEAYQEILRMPV